MKQQLSGPLAAIIVIIAVVLIVAGGWFFMFREKVTPSPTAGPGAAVNQAPPTATGTTQDPGNANAAAPRVD